MFLGDHKPRLEKVKGIEVQIRAAAGHHAIVDFYKNSFALKGLEGWKQMNGWCTPNCRTRLSFTPAPSQMEQQ
jgi:hypothetical protein